MLRVHQALFSTLVFAIIPTAVLGATSTNVEYVGGTVKSIPANSVGTFNFDDGKQMLFSYGDAAYQLSYDQITGTDISKAEGHHILHKIPVPQLNPKKRKETLSVHFKDESGAAGTLNFELAAEQADHAREMIAIMKKGPQNAVSNRANDWWGDKIWKTTRNQAAWDARNPAQPGTPSAATK